MAQDTKFQSDWASFSTLLLKLVMSREFWCSFGVCGAIWGSLCLFLFKDPVLVFLSSHQEYPELPLVLIIKRVGICF